MTRVVESAARAGVSQVLLSARGRATTAEVLDLAARHPGCVVPSVRADMYAEDELAPEWRSLLLRYPDRFVLAFDNVWPEHWSEKYVQQVRFWRNALGKLPADVAHAVAHGNAERLWKLSPAAGGQGCAAITPPPQ